MALRFQNRDDEVDRAAKETRATGAMVFLLVLAAVIWGAVDWFSGESLASYEKLLALLIGLGFVDWLASPYYHEFRIRTKEIDGKVSAIEKAVNASKEDQADNIAVTVSRIEWTVNVSKEDLAKLLERLTAIEEKLTEIQDARRI
ncbi:MAG: hypothetical protein ACLQM6_08140 [Acidobacteriaceae bacterium]